ncbi:hypothetical protein GBA52_006354 [Prunus armeniaca]|nr:hypothetical protein GBA52_006354 [Prunus armeniaca]
MEEVMVEVVMAQDEEEEDVVAVVVEVVNVVVQGVQLGVEVEVMSFLKIDYGIWGIKKIH